VVFSSVWERSMISHSHVGIEYIVIVHELSVFSTVLLTWNQLRWSFWT
jgi:anti-sigma factor ChrR (cupin superfamily)